jgi:hypothetical protein
VILFLLPHEGPAAMTLFMPLDAICFRDRVWGIAAARQMRGAVALAAAAARCGISIDHAATAISRS